MRTLVIASILALAATLSHPARKSGRAGTALEGAGRHDAETPVARNRQHGLRDNVDFRLRKLAWNRDRGRRSEPAQDFKRAPGQFFRRSAKDFDHRLFR